MLPVGEADWGLRFGGGGDMIRRDECMSCFFLGGGRIEGRRFKFLIRF